MDKHLNVIEYPNLSESIFVKSNGNFLNKQKHLPQKSVCELQNYIILMVYKRVFHGVRNEDVRVCIGDMYLRNYMPEHIKPTSNINNITW